MSLRTWGRMPSKSLGVRKGVCSLSEKLFPWLWYILMRLGVFVVFFLFFGVGGPVEWAEGQTEVKWEKAVEAHSIPSLHRRQQGGSSGSEGGLQNVDFGTLAMRKGHKRVLGEKRPISWEQSHRMRAIYPEQRQMTKPHRLKKETSCHNMKRSQKKNK